jgi:predicted DNA-binding transcriptional regulator AlpA
VFLPFGNNLSSIDDRFFGRVSATTLQPLLASLAVTADEVVGLVEIAGMFNVTKRTAIRYSKRDDFPAPLARLSAGIVWRRTDVEAWGEKHLPLKAGRPPRSESEGA